MSRIYNRYVKVVDDEKKSKLQKKYRIKESVNEGKICCIVLTKKK